jgi:hypothetical protein
MKKLTSFNEDDIKRLCLPDDVFYLLHDIAYCSNAKHINGFVERAQDCLKSDERPDSVNLLEAEIIWCEANRKSSEKSADFEDGFISGLRQAIFLITATPADFVIAEEGSSETVRCLSRRGSQT